MRVKALGAGFTNTALGLSLAEGPLPAAGAVGAALLVGSLGYGVSVVLDAIALRELGAAREAALVATAPFVGALAAWAWLGAPLGAAGLAGLGLMAAGVVALLGDRHDHEHTHDELEHEHLHAHAEDGDPHHAHSHGPDDPPGSPHSHRHRHARLVHAHPHAEDAHHRHKH